MNVIKPGTKYIYSFRGAAMSFSKHNSLNNCAFSKFYYHTKFQTTRVRFLEGKWWD